MRKRLFIALITVMVAVITIVAIVTRYYYKPEHKKTAASVIVPMASGDKEKNIRQSMETEDTALVSLIKLEADETLLSIVGADFDGDGYDDQVNAIKTLNSPFITLLVGLYNPKTGVYERKIEIGTEISSIQTFTYMGIDLVGDHSTALVYQGFSFDGDTVLKAFFIKNYNGRAEFKKIADYKADGTIFIQQIDRYDAYERSNANGSSYPIWVYTSDKTNNSTDQFQICYNWNKSELRYTEEKRIRVAGSRLAAKELARIQDGTVETFASFLGGIWYKTDAVTKETKYLSFNYPSREIIFYSGDREEVYNWVASTLRRNGIYLSTVNQEIENLKRRMDISLYSVDEISIRTQDDVRLLINESSDWDGRYKKANDEFLRSRHLPKETHDDISKTICDQVSWKTSEGSYIKFIDEFYNAENSGKTETGRYTFFNVSGDEYIQFKSASSGKSMFSSVYKITRDEVSSSGQNVKNIIFEACKIQGDGIIPLERRLLILTAVEGSAETVD
ncbi:MAG: pallilysin-related adhesin [Treponema sp.]|nr:pallilysin-related adhesin [Treponema sp.]